MNTNTLKYHPSLFDTDCRNLYAAHSDGFLLYNTFGFKAVSRDFAAPSSIDETVKIIKNADDTEIRILGGCSNIIFDGFFDGIVINPQIKTIDIVSESESEILLNVGAGIVWDDFVRFACENGFGGAENLSGIPGNVGASPVQNIGAYGTEVKDLIVAVKGIFIDACKTFELQNQECGFAYRDSIFKNELANKTVITNVVFRLTKSSHSYRLDYGNLRDELKRFDEINPANIRAAVIKIRADKLPDPNELGNAGSFFTNPIVSKETAERLSALYPTMPVYSVENKIKLSAGWLIEQAGLKGAKSKSGKVGIYEKQSLVLVNYGGATAVELLEFASSVRKTVSKKFGVALNTEVNIFEL